MSKGDTASWLRLPDPSKQAAQWLANESGEAERALANANQQAGTLAELALAFVQRTLPRHFEAWTAYLAEVASVAGRLGDAGTAARLQAYLGDAAERSVLFLDVLRQRGNSYVEREREGFKPVLVFDYEMIADGRAFERPVNYALVRITPPPGYPEPRENERPFVIIDPRAGHGSGIGGYKTDSEVGVALRDGHPVYFVIFYPQPEPGQTLADVTAAEALFLWKVRRSHPNAPKPIVIGNCQGGWATMMLAATHPDAVGLVVAAGAPLSYWAGVRGQNPLRYLGGLAGGTVAAILSSDLAGGKFDGAHLVQNFESLNPGNTWWKKYYNVYANIDTEADRFMEFERWWSGFYMMNGVEIRWILENLFIGNKLVQGGAVLDDGTPVDLRRIKSPVLVFASYGDNITPPQQALHWIVDLYPTTEEIAVQGKVIIYVLHQNVGHLGIFVSSSVARKEHQEIISVTSMIESLAPGLYEMLITIEDGARHVSFQRRTIEDVQAFCAGQDDEAKFIAVARLSHVASDAYDMWVRPFFKNLITPELADAMVRMHPMRQQRYFFSDSNPLLRDIGENASQARADRHPAEPDNPFTQLEKLNAALIEESWDFYRDCRDAFAEFVFHAVYGSPWMRFIIGRPRRARRRSDPSQIPEVQDALSRVADGGYAEAVIRMMVLMARARGSVRRSRLERANRVLSAQEPFAAMPPEERSRIIGEQTLIVDYAPGRAVSTLAILLPDKASRRRAIGLIREVAGGAEEMDAATSAMLARLSEALGLPALAAPPEATAAAGPIREESAAIDARRARS